MGVVMNSPESSDVDDGTPARARRKPQRHVSAFFESYWDDVYRDGGLQGSIYERRAAAVLELIRVTDPSAGARVLEIGCGAGLLTEELARGGLDV